MPQDSVNIEQLSKQLFAAVHSKDIKKVEELLERFTQEEQKELIFKTNDLGRTALHIAAAYGNIAILETLLSHLTKEEQKELIFKTNDLGETALHHATENDNVDIVERLLSPFTEEKQKDLILKTENWGFTAVHQAIVNDNIAVAKHLIGLICPEKEEINIDDQLINDITNSKDFIDYVTQKITAHYLFLGTEGKIEDLTDQELGRLSEYTLKAMYTCGLDMLDIVELSREWHKPNRSPSIGEDGILNKFLFRQWHPLPIGEKGESITTLNSGTKLEILNNTMELKDEGREQFHCIGESANYTNNCCNGNAHAVKVTDANGNRSTFYIEYDKNTKEYTVQHKGHDNHPLENTPLANEIEAFMISKIEQAETANISLGETEESKKDDTRTPQEKITEMSIGPDRLDLFLDYLIQDISIKTNKDKFSNGIVKDFMSAFGFYSHFSKHKPDHSQTDGASFSPSGFNYKGPVGYSSFDTLKDNLFSSLNKLLPEFIEKVLQRNDIKFTPPAPESEVAIKSNNVLAHKQRYIT